MLPRERKNVLFLPPHVQHGGEGAMVVLDDAQGLHGSWLGYGRSRPGYLSGIILRQFYLLDID